jgi:hypothetical protein
MTQKKKTYYGFAFFFNTLSRLVRSAFGSGRAPFRSSASSNCSLTLFCVTIFFCLTQKKKKADKNGFGAADGRFSAGFCGAGGAARAHGVPRAVGAPQAGAAAAAQGHRNEQCKQEQVQVISFFFFP